MDRNWPAPLQHAIRELAEINARQYVPTSITAADAAAYVDEDVLVGFWAVQRANGDAAEHRREISESLTDQQLKTLDCAIVAGHPSAVTLLRDATVAHVAEWLADEATRYQTSMEPTEAETTGGYGHYGRTPLDADRETQAREHNAIARAVGL